METHNHPQATRGSFPSGTAGDEASDGIGYVNNVTTVIAPCKFGNVKYNSKAMFLRCGCNKTDTCELSEIQEL